jgi:hypothetical protein
MPTQSPCKLRARLNILLAAACVPLFAGCAGTVIVDYALTAKLSGLEASGDFWQASSHEFRHITLHPQASTPFRPLRYEGRDFDWEFVVNPQAFGGAVQNKTQTRLCLFLDQGKLSSNLHSGEIPIRSKFYYRYTGGDEARVERRESVAFSPPPFCLRPSVKGSFMLDADLATLFPTGRMFNVRWPAYEATPAGKGIGNWIRIKVPMERNGKREELDLTLTVIDSAARSSYY